MPDTEVKLERVDPDPAEIDSVRDVATWFNWMAEQGGVPHPDDRAFQTCAEIRALGFAHEGEHPDGHVEVVGPLFDEGGVETAKRYDAAMARAVEVLRMHRLDVYALAMAANDRRLNRTARRTSGRLLRAGDVADVVRSGSRARRQWPVVLDLANGDPPRRVESVAWDEDARVLVVSCD